MHEPSTAPATPPKGPITHNMPLRVIIYVAGVLLLVSGVVMNTRCDMGASTVNCIPLVFSETTPLTLGQACMAIFAFDIAAQIIVFRRLTVRMALQIPFSVLFGWLVDGFDWLIDSGLLWFFQNPGPIMGTFMLVLGVLCTGVGVSMVMAMDFVPNPPDGFTQAFCKLTGLPFGRGKWANDCLRLVIALAAGLLMAHHVIGIGIGTVVCMFCIGNICQFVDDRIGHRYRHVYDPNIPTIVG